MIYKCWFLKHLPVKVNNPLLFILHAGEILTFLKV